MCSLSVTLCNNTNSPIHEFQSGFKASDYFALWNSPFNSDMSKSDLESLAKNNQWGDLLRITDSMIASGSSAHSILLFSALANLKLQSLDTAYLRAKNARALDQKSEWGVQLFCDACLACDKEDEAFAVLSSFLEQNPASERVRRFAADRTARLGKFDEAIGFNASRSSIRDVVQRPDRVIVVQAFNKPDTLGQSLASLMKCKDREKWSLLIYQDGFLGSKRQTEYEQQSSEVRTLIGTLLPQLACNFFSVEIIVSPSNLGTTACCKAAIDLASNQYQYIVFLEDDCIFSDSALSWFAQVRPLITGDVWLSAGESINFNDKSNEASAEQRSELATLAYARGLEGAYSYADFVPSSCFAITSEQWKKLGSVRGLPRGAENLNRYLKMSRAKIVMPIVPFVSDIGMLNPRGYSVRTHGAANVTGLKNTYLMASSCNSIREYEGDAGLIYAATTSFHPPAIKKFRALAAQGAQLPKINSQ